MAALMVDAMVLAMAGMLEICLVVWSDAWMDFETVEMMEIFAAVLKVAW